MHERDQRDERGGGMPATGVVLAGGQSRRMGQSKAGLLIGGEPLLQRVVRRLRLALHDALVVGSADLAALAPDTRIIQDLPLHQGQGPLAGLEAALDAIETRYAFVVACDMPFVAPDLVRAMVAQAGAEPSNDVLVLRTSQGMEPLHAVYSRACLPVVTRQLDAGERSLQRLVSQLRVSEVSEELVRRYDPADRSAFNANTPEEWEYALSVVDAEDTQSDCII